MISLFLPITPPNPAPQKFFSDCNIAVGRRGEKYTGSCGRGRAGVGGIKYYFYCQKKKKIKQAKEFFCLFLFFLRRHGVIVDIVAKSGVSKGVIFE